MGHSNADSNNSKDLSHWHIARIDQLNDESISGESLEF